VQQHPQDSKTQSALPKAKRNKTRHITHRCASIATPPQSATAPASTSSSAAATPARRLPLPAITARSLAPSSSSPSESSWCVRCARGGEQARGGGGWIEVRRESFEARAVLYPCRAALARSLSLSLLRRTRISARHRLFRETVLGVARRSGPRRKYWTFQGSNRAVV
jgi:hypothetical protein